MGCTLRKADRGGGGENVKDPTTGFTVQVTLVLRKRRNRAGFCYQLGMAHRLHLTLFGPPSTPARIEEHDCPTSASTPCSAHRGEMPLTLC